MTSALAPPPPDRARSASRSLPGARLGGARASGTFWGLAGGGSGLRAGAGAHTRTRQAPGGRRLSPPACRRRRCGANSGPPPPPLPQGASHAEPGAGRPEEPGVRGQVGFPPGGPRAARTARETPPAACPRFASAAGEGGRAARTVVPVLAGGSWPGVGLPSFWYRSADGFPCRSHAPLM